MSKNTTKLGAYYEQQALRLILDKGYQIVATNFSYPKVGEIDIVAEGSYQNRLGSYKVLIAIEVKARSSKAYGGAVQMVTTSKQRKIIKTMQYFVQQYPSYQNHDIRFDVIAFDEINKHDKTALGDVADNNIDGQVTWIEAAFLAD